MLKKDERDDVCQQIARFFYTSAIPFNAVNNPEFEKMLDMVGRFGIGLQKPSYHEIRETFLQKEKKRLTRILDDYRMEWKKTGCSVMSDGWSDKKRRSIVNFMVNSPKGSVFLTSYDTSEHSKTVEFVFQMLDNIVEAIGEENVVQVVTDNAANYKDAGELLMEKRKKLFWTPCVAHCIDMMLEDMDTKFYVHRETIEKGKAITTYIYGSSRLFVLMRHFTKGRELLRPGTTRFTTSYLTLGSLAEQKSALLAMITSDGWKKSSYAKTAKGRKIGQTIQDNNFWKNVMVCLKAAYPLISVLRMVDSGTKPAMGYIYTAMDEAKRKIQENFKNIKRSYEPIWDIIDARWEFQLHRPLHAAAYFLNPQLVYNRDFSADPDLKFGFYQVLRRFVPDMQMRSKVDVQVEYFKSAQGLFGIEEAIMARETKLPHVWWDAYGDECPELQKFAIRVLSLTCSSSACERNWSTFEMVHKKRRNRLKQQKINDLVFVMYNLKLQHKKVRKEKEPFTVEEIDSDDEWVVEEDEFGLEDSQVRQFSQLFAELEQKQENQEFVQILKGNSSQQKGGDDLELEIPDFDVEGRSSNEMASGEFVRYDDDVKT